jgi:hypothetical protein
MYGIRILAGDQWEILDEQGIARFQGAMRQCEDWLDYRDNILRRPPVCAAAGPRAVIVWSSVLVGLLGAATVSLGRYLLFLYLTTADGVWQTAIGWPADSHLET